MTALECWREEPGGVCSGALTAPDLIGSVAIVRVLRAGC